MQNQCEKCHDTGWVYREGENQFGLRVLYESTCTCETGLRRLWCLPARFLYWTWETFPGDPAVCDNLRAWSKDGGRPPWVLLTGSLGSGKTSLAVCAYKDARQRLAEGAVWWNVAALLEAVKSTFGKDDEERSDNSPLVRARERAAFLVLDDLGAERPTDWAQDTLRQILHTRYDRMLQTVITTNLSLTELETWVGKRAMDRIRHDSLVLALTGESLRQPAAV